jgi:predicted transcriptional regulator
LARSYRNGWKIILDVLKSGSPESVKKTHMMYRANLNHVSFNKYFLILLEQGYFVEVDDPDGGIMYRTSEKGIALLRTLDNVESKLRLKKRS